MDLGSNWHDSILEDFRPCTRPIVVAVNHRLLSRWDLKAGLPLKSDSEVSPISKEDWVALKIQCKCKLDFPLHNTVFENYKKSLIQQDRCIPKVLRSRVCYARWWGEDTKSLNYHISLNTLVFCSLQFCWAELKSCTNWRLRGGVVGA